MYTSRIGFARVFKLLDFGLFASPEAVAATYALTRASAAFGAGMNNLKTVP